jgi:hypothetical protein
MARLAKMNLNHAGENMGKAADNEAIKLRATYFNNLAVGTLLGGFVIPYIALFQRYPEVEATLNAVKSGGADMSNTDVKNLAYGGVALAAGIIMSRMFRYMAKNTIARLQD